VLPYNRISWGTCAAFTPSSRGRSTCFAAALRRGLQGALCRRRRGPRKPTGLDLAPRGVKGGGKLTGMDDLARWRPEFPILDSTVYMISNSLGAMPRGVADSLADYAHTWAARGARAWEERWWELALEVGNKIGAIVRAAPGSVSMHPNVTTAEMVVLSSLLPQGRRRKIVCPAMDFPSMIYLYRAHQALGFELSLVPAEPDFSIRTDRFLDAIDDETLVVALSHVLFRSSYVMDVAPIVERAHRHGAVVVLDAFQSAGIIPVDVTALDVEFATGGCLKWLCGGPGNAFLYARPDLLKRVRPRFSGWLARANPFAFDIEDDTLREDAMRMMNGTPTVPTFYAALPGLDIVTKVGVERIREKSKRMTGRLLDLVDARGWHTVTSRDPERVAGTVAIDVPDAYALAKTLNARDFVVDYRPGVGIRVSPHFYNTFEEIDRLVAELSDLVERRESAGSQQ
jgi:kynureninase